MWLIVPGASRPLPITPNSASGRASFGDVAQLRFAADFTAELLDRKETVRGSESALFLLRTFGENRRNPHIRGLTLCARSGGTPAADSSFTFPPARPRGGSTSRNHKDRGKTSSQRWRSASCWDVSPPPGPASSISPTGPARLTTVIFTPEGAKGLNRRSAKSHERFSGDPPGEGAPRLGLSTSFGRRRSRRIVSRNAASKLFRKRAAVPTRCSSPESTEEPSQRRGCLRRVLRPWPSPRNGSITPDRHPRHQHPPFDRRPGTKEDRVPFRETDSDPGLSEKERIQVGIERWAYSGSAPPSPACLSRSETRGEVGGSPSTGRARSSPRETDRA